MEWSCTDLVHIGYRFDFYLFIYLFNINIESEIHAHLSKLVSQFLSSQAINRSLDPYIVLV